MPEAVDMSAAWLAHAPPPPPSTAVRKPRRSSSYEPLSAQKGTTMNDIHTQGGYLPPSSHSPEPPRARRTSIGELKDAASSSSTPSSPIKRARSKVTSNPPAPSAFYNYQHQLQQQKQHQAAYHQQQPAAAPIYPQAPQMTAPDAMYGYAAAAPPASVPMAHSSSESASSPAYAGYARERRDSAPVVSYSAGQQPSPVVYAQQIPFSHGGAPHPPAAYSHTPGVPVSMPVYPSAQAQVAYASTQVLPGAHYQYAQQPQIAPVPGQQYYSVPQQPWMQQPQNQALPQQYYNNVAAPMQQPQPWEQPGIVMPSPPSVPVAFPTSSGAISPAVPANAQAFPPPQASSPPMPVTNGSAGPMSHLAYASELSRHSTTSSVGSVRRPLPQPTRTSSNPSAPGSPVSGVVNLSHRASVRRGLPRPPSGSAATISAASSHGKTDPSSPGSPLAGSTSKLPTGALNRTESVRLAAEALMARGVPQRRPLRSALASTTFSPPMTTSSLVDSSSTPSRQLPSSQSDPVSAVESPTVNIAALRANQAIPQSAQMTPRSSQSAASLLTQTSAQTSGYAVQTPERSAPSAPARYQDAMHHAAQPPPTQKHTPQAPARNEAPHHQEAAHVTDALAQMCLSQKPGAIASNASASAAPSVRVFSFDGSEEEPEKPRRRRGSSVSRAGPAPGQKIIQQAPMPTIVFPGGDDDDGAAPSIQISAPDGVDASVSSEQMISVSADDDDERSQTSNGSKGPSISVSFSAEPSAKSQRAGTSHSAAATPYSKAQHDVSASAVGSGSGCRGCRKWIAGKVVHALGHTFHPGCFTCAHCSEGLEHVAFYEHEGLPYCHFDYHELFSKRCFHCRTPIVDERYITVQDEELTGQDGETKERCYHELHFFCANCGDPFLDPKAAGSAAGSDPGLMTADENGKVQYGGMEFIVHKGYPYCEKCHVNLHKPRCKGCKKPIVYDLITALGGKYHPECFTCTSCAQPFTDTQFFVKDGRPYDEDCYKVLLRNMI